ncbi:MAG: hypothetical protein J0I77_04315 [Rudaea sp.]|uniref:DUF7933 domain-containing protein n=1 Tax=unclassified Rudaea TaxID=2627037 RepID=UPI0010F78339|nr:MULTISPECIES: SdrD B-like domain-containing protein [unclassified Rudaea]MBN8884917.1 hypothetical protein [Rudaea sp.]
MKRNRQAPSKVSSVAPRQSRAASLLLFALAWFAFAAHAGTVTMTMTSNAGVAGWNVGRQAVSGNASATYTLNLTNSGTTTTGITLTDRLPVGLFPGSVSGTGGLTCSSVASGTTGPVTYTVTCTGSVSTTATATISVWVDQLAMTGAVANPPAGNPSTITATNALVNTVAATATGGTITPTVSVISTINGIRQVLSSGSCPKLTGTLGANTFSTFATSANPADGAGSFGSMASNTVGNSSRPGTFTGPLTGGGLTSLTMWPLSNQTNANVMTDGYYTISNRSSFAGNTRNGVFYWVAGDRSSLETVGPQGDPNSLMMVVNATINPTGQPPTAFFQQTITGLLPYTNYQFSIWAMHVDNPNNTYWGTNPSGLALPYNLQFAVNRQGVDAPGTRTVLYMTGTVYPTSPPTWNQYAVLFNTGAATQVTFYFQNNGNGGAGNDLALDDIVLATCTDLPAGSVNGTLYYDDNRNSAANAGEAGLPAGIVVNLVNNVGVIVASDLTDQNGNYSFQNVVASSVAAVADPTNAGAYTVQVAATNPAIPAGVTLGTSNNVSALVLPNQIAIADFGYLAVKLTLQKTWINATPGDAAVITATNTIASPNSGTPAVGTATFNDTAPSANATDTYAALLHVGYGQSVNFAETVASASSYLKALVCTGNAGALSGNTLTTSGADVSITCAYRNTRVPNVMLTKAFNPPTISSGSTSTLTIAIANTAPGAVDLTGLALTDNFPASPSGMVIANPSAAGTTCTAAGGATVTAVPGGTSVALGGGSVNANSSCTIQVNVTAP